MFMRGERYGSASRCGKYRMVSSLCARLRHVHDNCQPNDLFILIEKGKEDSGLVWCWRNWEYDGGGCSRVIRETDVFLRVLSDFLNFHLSSWYWSYMEGIFYRLSGWLHSDRWL